MYPHFTFTYIFQATKDSVGGSPTDVNSYVTAQSFWEASLVHLPQWSRSPASETVAGARKTPKIANVPKQLQNTGGLEPKHVLAHPQEQRIKNTAARAGFAAQVGLAQGPTLGSHHHHCAKLPGNTAPYKARNPA